jgi:uncharacterized membrane protein (DUF485 family)
MSKQLGRPCPDCGAPSGERHRAFCERSARKTRNAAWVAIALFIFLMWLGYGALVYHNRELLALYVMSGSLGISVLWFLGNKGE